MLQNDTRYAQIKEFYDREYYGLNAAPLPLPWHYHTIAARLGDLKGKQVLDVACGTGDWLALLAAQGAEISGIDISERAINVCKRRFQNGQFHLGAAEQLSFTEGSFDLVTCLGSLEHFIDPDGALMEMRRVAKPGATFLLLVPNAGFLPRRLGFFRGTQQAKIREVVRSLDEWQLLFDQVGLVVKARWSDLHLLSKRWICMQGWRGIPLRFILALSLTIWPLAWQYQVYHYCTGKQP